jgi:hypothetical protein
MDWFVALLDAHIIASPLLSKALSVYPEIRSLRCHRQLTIQKAPPTLITHGVLRRSILCGTFLGTTCPKSPP